MAGTAQEYTLTQFGQWAEFQTAALQSGLREPLEACGQLLIYSTKKNFDESHSPDGSPWLPVKYPLAGRTPTPLRDKGLLMASVVSGTGHIESYTPTSVTIGTNLEYASTHQDGATIRPVSGQNLAIPLTVKAARYNPRQSPKYPGELFLVAHDGKHPTLCELVDKGRGKKRKTYVAAQYLLVPQVEVPQRQFIGINEEIEEGVTRIFGDWMGNRLAA